MTLLTKSGRWVIGWIRLAGSWRKLSTKISELELENATLREALYEVYTSRRLPVPSGTTVVSVPGSAWDVLLKDRDAWKKRATTGLQLHSDINAYQRAAQRTMNCSDDLANWALGLAGECGEVVELVKKAVYHGVDLSNEKLIKELGDVLWYVAAIATTRKIVLGDILTANIEKLKARYPEGFVEGGGKRDG